MLRSFCSTPDVVVMLARRERSFACNSDRTNRLEVRSNKYIGCRARSRHFSAVPRPRMCARSSGMERGFQFVALDVGFAVRIHPVIQKDIARGGVGVALAHGFHKGFAAVVFGNHGGIGKMRRNVIGAGLHADFVSLGPGIPDEAQRLVSAGPQFRFLRGGRERRAFMLGRSARAFPELDNRIDCRGRYRANPFPCRWSDCAATRCRDIFSGTDRESGPEFDPSGLFFPADIQDRHATLR